MVVSVCSTGIRSAHLVYLFYLMSLAISYSVFDNGVGLPYHGCCYSFPFSRVFSLMLQKPFSFFFFFVPLVFASLAFLLCVVIKGVFHSPNRCNIIVWAGPAVAATAKWLCATGPDRHLLNCASFSNTLSVSNCCTLHRQS